MEESKVPPTVEQIAEMKKNMEAHWDSQMPFLEKQAQYEKLIMEIEEYRLKRISYQFQLAKLEEDQKAAAAQNQNPNKEEVKSLRREK